jgi:5-methylcytosine-specific restriction protein B
LDALKELGGSATPTKVREQIITDLHLTDDIVNETYGKSNTNKFANQVAFARNYLVYAGYTVQGFNKNGR